MALKGNLATWILVVTALTSRGYAQICPTGSGSEYGLPTAVAGASNNYANTGDAIKLTEKGTVNCFGVISHWTFRYSGLCTNSKFQVWRDKMLVGENTVTCDLTFLPSPTEKTVGVSQSERIPVEPGDTLGWKQLGGAAQDMVESNPGGGAVDYAGCNSITPGQNCGLGNTDNVDILLKATVIEAPYPTLDNLPNTVYLYENEAVGTLLLDVEASHESNAIIDNAGNVMEEPVSLTFALHASATPNFRFGTVTNGRPYTAEIESAVTFDYEAAQSYTVGVTVEGHGLTTTDYLQVEIMNRNEAHVIDNLPTTVYISTAKLKDDDVFEVLYSDVDIYDVTAKTFFIDAYSPQEDSAAAVPALPFYIDQNTGILRCSQDLANWIGPGTYTVDIAVVDELHKVVATLTVEIQNIKQPPVIQNLPLAMILPEDALPRSPVFRVSATGPDLTQIRFSIDDVTPIAYFYWFVVDEVTGEVTLGDSADLDLTIQDTFTLTVGIRDDVQPGIQKNLVVNLEWRNRQPKFDPEVYFLTMDEECSSLVQPCPGSPRNPPWQIDGFTMSLYDRDVTTGNPVLSPDVLSCIIRPGFAFEKFESPLQDCGTLFLTDLIDVDATPEYAQINLTIRADDAYGGGALARVYITVLDINDNSPVFSPSLYQASIDENTPGGVSVLTVTATDRDSGLNGEFTFSVVPDGVAEDYFEMDPVAGVLYTKQPADYETFTDFQFEVSAIDKGTPSNQGRADVTVNIRDVNDNRPYWVCTNRPLDEPYDWSAPCFYNLELRSDTLVGFDLMTVGAEDVDTVSTNVTYFLLKPDDYFALQTIDGVVSVKRELSHYVEHILYAYGQDNGVPNLLTRHLRIRIDTYDSGRQLIDFTLEIPLDQFNQSSTQQAFLEQLRILLNPWFPKIERVKLDKDKTTVTVYALRDNSTYLEENLPSQKDFVDRDELLPILRKNILGVPSDVMVGPDFAAYGVIKVAPTYPIWILDTVEGLVTLALIILAFVALVIGLTVGLMKRYQRGCFKKHPPSHHDWNKKNFSEMKDRQPPKQTGGDQNGNVRQRQPANQPRRASVETIHSLVFDPSRNVSVT